MHDDDIAAEIVRPVADATPVEMPDEGNAQRSLARNALHLVMGQAGTTALAVLLSAALGRYLGAADYGLYYLITSTSTFVYVLVEWGQTAYVIREVARYPEQSGALLGSALLLRLAGALLFAALTAVALSLFGYEPRITKLSAIFICTSLPFSLAQAHGLIFRGRERMDLDAMVSVVNKLLVVGLTLLVFAFGGRLLGATLAQGVAGVGALALAAALSRRLNDLKLRTTLAKAREMLIGGTPIVVLNLANALHTYLDVLLLSKLASAESVGWYGAARNIMGTLAAASFILGTASFPRLSRAAHDIPSFRREIEAALRPLLGLAALAMVGTLLFADLAVGIVFGKAKFGPAGVILQVGAIGQALLFVDVLLGTSVVAAGRPKQLAVMKAICVVIAQGLNLVLIPYFQRRYGNGGLGVVVAFATSEILMFSSATAILPRGSLGLPLLIDAGRALLASAGTLLLFAVLPPMSPFLGLPLCVLVFVGLSVALGLVRREEFEELKSLLGRSRGAPRPPQAE
jgi:O-antigen/teichoic acid export membrane protein